ncbi:GNAT family N-acetyltransferase [Buchananella hordeovulneris]|uniref:GNAT family N-acetyltransferase n=1 Tax=Buchananella hordeovulneris TaxID=52770 RepID=UPI0026DB2ECC|nr:GNAT family N-acetyltransferase [Buchananella hordeovulneris]MDO5081474.1 GNAT family N-acetyltransferase [Buchananella hordeovulneris]
MTDEIVRAQVTDLPAIRRVLVEALGDDPLLQWYFPPAYERSEVRRSRIALYFSPTLEWLVTAALVHVARVGPDVVGFAAWVPHGTTPPTSLPRLGDMTEIVTSPRRAERITTALRQARSAAPDCSGDYLFLLAVLPAAQGQGVGARLLQAGLAEVQTPWLESTNPRNLPFYHRHGFRTIHTASLGDSGVHLHRLAQVAT